MRFSELLQPLGSLARRFRGPIPRRPKTRFQPLVLERLEDRQLLAADVTLDNGLLAVEGTEGDDTIEVSYANGGQTIRASVEDADGNPLAVGTFDAADVQGVFIDALAGDDEAFNTTDLPDEVRGGPGNDELEGGTGPSLVLGGGGVDDITGRNGDDLLVVQDANFEQVRGGDGIDTLRFDGSGVTLDLRIRSDALLIRLERIDLNGGGNHLILDDNEVRVATDANNTLDVLGDSTDTLHIDQGWTVNGTETVDGQPFRVLTKADATLRVHADVAIVTNVVEIESLLGDGAFVIHGIDEEDTFGRSVDSAGDFNGDGFADLIVGAPGAVDGFLGPYGQAYVVFGSDSGFGQRVNIADFVDDPNLGFGFQGRADDNRLGSFVSFAGDLNGDGFDEIVVGVPGEGVSYVVFGRETDGNPIDIAPPNGFAIQGGSVVDSAGDVNGDGFGDLLVNTSLRAHIIFGHAAPYPAEFDVDDLDGTNGFTVSTLDSYDGLAAAGAGDVNGDGFDDLILGVPGGDRELDPDGPRDYDIYKYDTGEAYLIFGKANGFAADFELANDDGWNLDGFNGVLIKGAYEKDRLGVDVSPAGDINGDGYDDVILLADSIYDPNDPDSQHHDTRHQAYVIFGAPAFGKSIEISSLNGVHGFVIDNIPDQEDENGVGFGAAVHTAGDFNGDGIDDLLIGAPRTFQDDVSPTQFPLLVDTGAVFVVYGRSDWIGTTVDLTRLNGQDGFALRGPTPTFDIDRDPQVEENGAFGGTLAALGDFNGDGIVDIAIGDRLDDTNGENAGAVYVIFGGQDGYLAGSDYGAESHPTHLLARTAGGEWWMGRNEGGRLVNESLGSWDESLGWRDVLYADFTGDGLTDILARTSAGLWRLVPNTGDGPRLESGEGAWQPSGAWNEAAGWRNVMAADINGDGVADVVGRTAAGDWWAGISTGDGVNTGNGLLNRHLGAWSEAAGWQNVMVADINGDGFDDLLGRTAAGDWWAAVNDGVNTGNGFTNRHLGAWSPDAGWQNVTAADVDGDGDDDLVGRTAGGDWWFAISTPAGFSNQWTGHWAAAADWRDVRFADMDGDGRTDIVGRAAGGDWWLGRNTEEGLVNERLGNWSPSAGWRDVTLVDFDDDGRLDLLGRTADGAWWLGANTPSGLDNRLVGHWSPAADWQDVAGAALANSDRGSAELAAELARLSENGSEPDAQAADRALADEALWSV